MKKNSPPMLALFVIFLLSPLFLRSGIAQSTQLAPFPKAQLGDLSGDGVVTALDGNITLAYDAGLDVNYDIVARTDKGIGDVNGDGLTNARDALIILSYDAQVPLEKPVAVNGRVRNVSTGSNFLEEAVDVLTLRKLDQENGIIEISILVDMNRVNQRLGSYKTNLAWNPDALHLLEVQGGQAEGFGHPVVNLSEFQDGRATIVDANPHGARGVVFVSKLVFKVLDNSQSDDLEVNMSNLSAAGTLSPLRAKAKRIN